MRKSEHAPPELEQYLNLTSEGLVQWAQRLGPSVGLVAELILADRAVDGLRPVRALIRLADNAGIQKVKYTVRGGRYRKRFRNAIYFHLGGLDLSTPPMSPGDPLFHRDS